MTDMSLVCARLEAINKQLTRIAEAIEYFLKEADKEDPYKHGVSFDDLEE